jgi:hypothetical protein
MLCARVSQAAHFDFDWYINCESAGGAVTHKRDLLTYTKETYQHTQKRPTNIHKRDLLNCESAASDSAFVVYTGIYIFIHAYTYTCTYTYIYVYYVCVCVYIYMYICICMYIYIYTYTHSICICIYMYIICYIYIYTYMYMYYMYIYICIYISIYIHYISYMY